MKPVKHKNEGEMKMLKMEQTKEMALFLAQSETFIRIYPKERCSDRFVMLEEGVWEWIRTYEYAADHMQMQLEVCYLPEFWMVPAVNYNGNGFGKTGDDHSIWRSEEEYFGMGEGNEPWIYAAHRCSAPAATYSEGLGYCVALMGDANDNVSCSIWKSEQCTYQTLYWPVAEGPRVLRGGGWGEGYRETMPARTEFKAYIILKKITAGKQGYDSLLDFAWRKFAVIPEQERSDEEIWNLSIAYAKSLWETAEDGFYGFNLGHTLNNKEKIWAKVKEHKYEIGWCGQNGSLANSMLIQYIRKQDHEALEQGLSVLDSWAGYAPLSSGVFRTHMDSTTGGTERDIVADACNMGTAAIQFFHAAELVKRCNVERPIYLQTALNICDFAVKAQKENGMFAKSWNFDGTVAQQNGTVGCFLVPPLVKAWKLTTDQKYLDAALRAYEYYRKELLETGYTTAGALDTFCVDKESAMPLLAAGLDLYDATGQEEYKTDAIRAAWYLSTWQWHYNTKFPEGSILSELGYKTCGTTSVSTAHHHLDAYALYYYKALLRLEAVTGNPQWAERAKAIFNNSSQMISDGTLEIMGKVRPAGSQDEGIYHTCWGREFAVSQWLVAWPCALRLEAMWKDEEVG
jgi:hypothetical protein